jgi:MFS family permease
VIRWIFTCLVAATTASVCGNRAVDFTYLWTVLDRGGSGFASGALVTVSAAGAVAGSFLLTPLIDRMGAVRFSIVGDLASVVSIAAIAGLLSAGTITLPLFAGLAFAGAMMDTSAMTARASLIPRITEQSGMTIASGNSTLHAFEGIAHIVATPLAGWLIHLSGAPVALIIISTMFAFAALLMAALRRLDAQALSLPRNEENIGLFAGFRMLWRAQEMRVLLIVAFVFVLFVLPVPALGIPYIFSRAGLSSGTLAFVTGATAATSLLGALSYGLITRWVSNAQLVFAGFVIEGIVLVTMAFASGTFAFIVLGAVSGLATGPLTPLFSTVIQQRAEPQHLTRILGAFNTLVFAAAPAGFLAVGALIDAIGIQSLFVSAGLFGALTGIIGAGFLARAEASRVSGEAVGMESRDI